MSVLSIHYKIAKRKGVVNNIVCLSKQNNNAFSMLIQCTLKTGDQLVGKSLRNIKWQQLALVRCLSTDFATPTKVKSFQDLPGPSSLPFFGIAMHFLPVVGKFHSGRTLFEILQKDYGDLVRIDSTLGRNPQLFIYKPHLIEEVFRAEDMRYPGREVMFSNKYFREHIRTDVFGKYPGLVSTSGHEWREFRSIVNPPLLQPKLVRASTELLEEVTMDMMERLKTLPQDYVTNNFNLEMNKWGLESIGVVSLGTRLGCLNPDFLEDSDAGRLLELVPEIFRLSFLLDFRPSISKFVTTPNFKKAMKAFEDQLRICTKLIDEAINRVKMEGERGDERRQGDILAALYDLDPEVAYVMAVDMLLAGVDTTANSATALLYLLAENPEKQEKLRLEIQSKNDRKPYLRACIKESSRLLPIAPANMRTLTADMTLDGYLIPKGVDCLFPTPVLCRNEKYYKNAKEFIPERWIVGSDDPLYTGKTSPFTMLPFGYGARSCIGRRIAELELEIFITCFLMKFQVRWEGPEANVEASLLNTFKPPFNFKFQILGNE